jgi:hypothetical protein
MDRFRRGDDGDPGDLPINSSIATREHSERDAGDRGHKSDASAARRRPAQAHGWVGESLRRHSRLGLFGWRDVDAHAAASRCAARAMACPGSGPIGHSDL